MLHKFVLILNGQTINPQRISSTVTAVVRLWLLFCFFSPIANSKPPLSCSEFLETLTKKDIDPLIDRLSLVSAQERISSDGVLYPNRFWGGPLTTVHFTVGGLMPPYLKNLDTLPYAVVIPLRPHLSRTTSFFTLDTPLLGPVPMAGGALLRPARYPALELPDSVTQITYTGTLRKAVNDYLKKHGQFSVTHLSADSVGAGGFVHGIDLNSGEFPRLLKQQHPWIEIERGKGILHDSVAGLDIMEYVLANSTNPRGQEAASIIYRHFDNAVRRRINAGPDWWSGELPHYRRLMHFAENSNARVGNPKSSPSEFFFSTLEGKLLLSSFNTLTSSEIKALLSDLRSNVLTSQEVSFAAAYLGTKSFLLHSADGVPIDEVSQLLKKVEPEQKGLFIELMALSFEELIAKDKSPYSERLNLLSHLHPIGSEVSRLRSDIQEWHRLVSQIPDVEPTPRANDLRSEALNLHDTGRIREAVEKLAESLK